MLVNVPCNYTALLTLTTLGDVTQMGQFLCCTLSPKMARASRPALARAVSQCSFKKISIEKTALNAFPLAKFAAQKLHKTVITAIVCMLSFATFGSNTYAECSDN